jgi:hypothetical protein
MSDIVSDLTSPHLSTAREKVLEHRLASELAVHMLQRGVTLDILRSEYDSQGYDLVLEAGGVIRHLQLKASRDGGKRRHVEINVRLRAKPAGCVVWMSYDPVTLAITALRWFGGRPGEPLPDLGSAVTRHSKGDSAGTKSARPALRNVSIPRFERLTDLGELADRLFGSALSEASANAVAKLQMQFGQQWRNRVAGELGGTTFDTSVHWAHMIDGYGVLEQMLELDPPAWLESKAQEARMGRLSDDAGQLWTQLFLEHRRWRMASPVEPDAAQRRHLDALAARAASAVRVQLLKIET